MNCRRRSGSSPGAVVLISSSSVSVCPAPPAPKRCLSCEPNARACSSVRSQRSASRLCCVSSTDGTDPWRRLLGLSQLGQSNGAVTTLTRRRKPSRPLVRVISHWTMDGSWLMAPGDGDQNSISVRPAAWSYSALFVKYLIPRSCFCARESQRAC